MADSKKDETATLTALSEGTLAGSFEAKMAVVDHERACRAIEVKEFHLDDHCEVPVTAGHAAEVVRVRQKIACSVASEIVAVAVVALAPRVSHPAQPPTRQRAARDAAVLDDSDAAGGVGSVPSSCAPAQRVRVFAGAERGRVGGDFGEMLPLVRFGRRDYDAVPGARVVGELAAGVVFAGRSEQAKPQAVPPKNTAEPPSTAVTH